MMPQPPPTPPQTPSTPSVHPTTQGPGGSGLGSDDSSHKPGASTSPLSLRAIVIGAFLVVFFAALTPFNDYVVYNTLLTAGFFPPAVVLSLFALVLLVNGCLHACLPRRAFRPGELATILTMLLLGCAVPGQGLVRALLPTLVTSQHFARTDPAFEQVWANAHIPAELFPSTSLGFRVVSEFYGRTPGGESPPYIAWLKPLLLWSILFGGMYTMLLSMASLLRAQWAQNERLVFPIAQLETALIQSPKPGHFFNDLLASRSFWIALSGVFILHTINGLNVYFPRYIPLIPLKFDLAPVLTAEPWRDIHWSIKASSLFFTVVGMMYFIPGRIGFSMFFVFLVLQGLALGYQTGFQQSVSPGAWADQHLGAATAFALGVLWVGRRHWAMVTRHVFIGPSRNETVSYRTPALLFLGGCAIMTLWFVLAGTSLWISLLNVGFALLAHLAIARIVAETGLPIMRVTILPLQLVTALPASLFTPRDVYFASATGTLCAAFPTRDSSLAMALHAHKVLDDLDAPPSPAQRRTLVGLMALSLGLAFIASVASGLYCYYSYATPISSRVQQPVLNDHLLLVMPRSETVDPMIQHAQGSFAGKSHSPATQVSLGFAVMATLQILAWTTANSPIAPIGYLVATTSYIQFVWWSVAVGWLLKALIVRFGGASLYRQARPFFVGLIFGECLAATLWLLVSLIMALTGNDYQQIRLLPT